MLHSFKFTIFNNKIKSFFAEKPVGAKYL